MTTPPNNAGSSLPRVATLAGGQLPIAAPTLAAACLQFDSPEVASLPIEALRVSTQGCLLPEGACLLQGQPRSFEAPRNAPRVARPTQKLRTCTRIRPPRDVVKLTDRLQYLLQPPLESLLSAKNLRFPFKPFPYQLDGVAFLYPRRHAVLADEMGLGKTMQTITAIRLLAHSAQVRRALLVCPKPLLSNWRREFALWAPELAVVTLEGGSQQREWAWQNSSAVVTMTNYETMVRDAHLLEGLGEYDLVVIDEAQRVKNRNSAASDAVRRVTRRMSWALTGTPIENSLEDLIGIFEFVSPGKVQSGQSAIAVRGSTSDCMLRRTKEQVLTDLPPKTIRDEQIDLSPDQWASYARAEEEGVLELEGLGVDIRVQHVFELVLRLKQVCNFDPRTGSSSKLERLLAELEECAASGRKAIVFSQWVDTIEKLSANLAQFNPVEYHGRVPHKRRDAVIERFRNDPQCSVILMSYGAGS
ncbi:MAG: DEAD/DEAH box helicase, partial [Planctomycetales bacterium]|nr:DEAD/DEAH box helicase [Planctomycetales bacterium]